ncbi:MAG: alpha/beta hydrolase [Deltaproteobacteria bacterium]|nr:alpha/beta hydrolase [Deltaproteobacteria bacterium]
MRPEDLAVEHRFATTNGVRLHYAEAGPRDAPPVLLLHGFPELWWSWRHQIGPLVDAGFRVIVPDQRGYGDSEKHGPFHIDTLVSDLVGLLDAAGVPRAHVVGHDWGGAVAWHLAATRPELCDRLVVMNCPHPTMMARALRSSPKQLRNSWYIFMFQLPFFPEWYLVRDDARAVANAFYAMAVDRSAYTAEELAPYRAAMKKPGAARAAVGWYRAAFRDALSGRAALHLPMVEAKTTLIWARPDRALDFDRLVPGTERFVRDLTVRIVEGCGHFLQTEQPTRVNPLLLEGLGAGGA